jgi:hypothetical protein
MSATKIRLSPEEMELVMQSGWILTKNRVLKKVWQLLEEMQSIQEEYMIHLPEEVKKVNAKISKGENYQGLPWLILDQPRYFNKEHIFAIRELFWWGNFFSSTLHLAGNYKAMHEKKILASLDQLKEQDFYLCVNTDPWEHHFEEGNFEAMRGMSNDKIEELVKRSEFIKLSKKIPLDRWDTVEDELLGTFGMYIKVISG